MYCSRINNIYNKEFNFDNFFKMTTIENLLELLALHGGSIVSTASLRPNEINQARASERMYVNENSLGYVWMPNTDKFPETKEEIINFEKWFPLDEELPDELKDVDCIYKYMAIKNQIKHN